jgi:restriction endonuclease S subunit
MRAEYGKGLRAGDRDMSGSIPVYGSAGVVGYHSLALVSDPVIIVGRKGNAGSVSFSTIPCWPIDTTYFLRVPRQLDVRYLAYQLEYRSLGSFDSSTAVPSLRRQDLESQPLSIAPLNEQRRIAIAIDEQFSRLDAAAESTESAAKRLPQLRAAVLNSLFSGDWPDETLSSITHAERPIRYGILMPKEHIADGVLYVRVKDYPAGKIVMEGLRRTSPEIAAKYRRATLKTGDVLLAIRGTYGRVAIVPPQLEGGNITQDTARISPLPHMDPRYVAAYLTSGAAQSYFSRVARGVAVKGVNIGDLRTMPIPVPPLNEQHRIVAEVEQQLSLIDSMCDAIVTANRRSAALRRAILERAFRGELVSQDPNDEPASALLERVAAGRVKAASSRRTTVPP